MEALSLAGLLLLAQIVIVDILLAGDNAVVIGMAARNLPHHLQKKAIFWGTAGAILLRLVLAFLFVEALHTIPFLHLIGGLLLLWISYTLMLEKEEEHHIEAKSSLTGAIFTIVIADGVMSIDNVLAVVGTAHGHMMYVMLGMLITVPIIVWGSTIFIKLIERFPIILYLGGSILAWVAGGMIADEKYLVKYLGGIHGPFAVGCGAVILVVALLTNKYYYRRKNASKKAAANANKSIDEKKEEING